jgi:hypothetical protein
MNAHTVVIVRDIQPIVDGGWTSPVLRRGMIRPTVPRRGTREHLDSPLLLIADGLGSQSR